MPTRNIYVNDDVYARLVYFALQKKQKLNDLLRECIELGLKQKEEGM